MFSLLPPLPLPYPPVCFYQDEGEEGEGETGGPRGVGAEHPSGEGRTCAGDGPFTHSAQDSGAGHQEEDPRESIRAAQCARCHGSMRRMAAAVYVDDIGDRMAEVPGNVPLTIAATCGTIIRRVLQLAFFTAVCFRS